jgi:ParB family transcriptional regulator, chromosome partitioning protein
MEELETKKIRVPKRPLRSDIGQIDELTASIVEKGLLEPIIVRPVDGGFEVVAGYRRLEAFRRLNISRITSHVVDMNDKEAFEVSLTENIQRRTLNYIEEGEAFKKYVDEYGYGGESELARKLGKSPSYVSRRIAFLRLPKHAREELLRQRKGSSVAQELLSLNQDEVNGLTDLMVESEIRTRNETRKMVKITKKGGGDDRALDAFGSPFDKKEEIHRRSIDRVLSRSIASLELCAHRLDEVFSCLDDGDWLIKEILIRNRRLIHNQVDELIRLKKKTQRLNYIV